MKAWYFPSWRGDFRLVATSTSTYRDLQADDSKTSVLEIVEPTSDETTSLNAFLKLAKAKGWTAVEEVKIDDQKKQNILLTAPVAEAGVLLLPLLKPADRTITAIRSAGGKLAVHDSATLTPDVIARDETPGEPKRKKGKKEEPEKAASLARPTPCCPQCVPGAVDRASEVLLSFLTPDEHESWAQKRALVIEGGITGHRYLLAHRHSKLAARIGRICYDLDDRCVIHFHDNSVPPEEEVLAAKLILEHREPWLRNEATCFGGSERFKNPFGDASDGAWDSGFTGGLGESLRLWFGS